MCEKIKKPNNPDYQDRVDAMSVSLEKDSAMMSNAMQNIIDLTGGSAESPSTKRNRHFKELSESIALLQQEKREMLRDGDDITSIEQQLADLRTERQNLRAARSSGTNLGGAFDRAAN